MLEVPVVEVVDTRKSFEAVEVYYRYGDLEVIHPRRSTHHHFRPIHFNMASSHGVPRVAREGDGEKERNDIRDYRALLDQVSAKVCAQSSPPQPWRWLMRADTREGVH